MLDLILKIDYWLFTQINSGFTHRFADVFFIWITDLHKTQIFKIIIIPAVFFVFLKKYKRPGVTYFIFLILALSTNDFIGAKVKNYFERPRPEFNISLDVQQRTGAGSFSFYSNHASNMFTFATYTSNFFPMAKIFLWALAGTVAYSRVYDGVHYPSDVLVGSLFGLIWGLLFSKLVTRLLVWLETKKGVA